MNESASNDRQRMLGDQDHTQTSRYKIHTDRHNTNRSGILFYFGQLSIPAKGRTLIAAERQGEGNARESKTSCRERERELKERDEQHTCEGDRSERTTRESVTEKQKQTERERGKQAS